MSGIDRNAPCPCGSGKKYKRCCLARHEPAASPRRAWVHDADEELLDSMIRFARNELGLRETGQLIGILPQGIDLSDSEGFWFEWMLLASPFPVKSIAQAYLESSRRVVHREWLLSRMKAWLSVQEIVELRPGEGITCQDALTGRRTEVRDIQSSLHSRLHTMMFGSLVEHEGVTYMGTMHPQPLPPREGHAAAAEMRRLLRVRVNQRVAPERLREPETMFALAKLWSTMADAWHHRPPPQMTNTDGDPLLVTLDHFVTAPGARQTLLARLATMEGAEPPGDEDGQAIVRVIRIGKALHGSLETTLIGRFVIEPSGKAVLETNSMRRANMLRARLEAACGELVTHRAREHSDVQSLIARMTPEDRQRGSDARLPPDVEAELVREYKARHYATWPDVPIPDLGGLTPREAARGKPAARRKLAIILASMEHQESGLPPAQRHDFGPLREELGVPR